MRPFLKMAKQAFHYIVASGFAAVMTCSAFADPVIDNVAAGQVTIQQSPGSTVVNQSSQQAIINWKSFNIGHGESTHFDQPVGGIALNRINPSQGASQIYGSLTSTGQIILMNPAGFYFGPSAYVNVGGMIATTANISDQNFMNGLYQFSKVNGYSGAVINEGQIIAAQNGLIALVAPGVVNNGLVQANLGKIVLASGDAFTLDFTGDHMINFAVNAKTSTRGFDKDGQALSDGVKNTGSLIANAGTILISASDASGVLDQMINLQGVVQAKSFAQKNGELIISADTDKGVVKIASNIDVSGKNAGEKGGSVTVTGHNILLDAPTFIDASGDDGGGTVNIGGSYQGKGPLANANAVVMMPDAIITASALTRGDGGAVVLWSDNLTKFYGKILSQGGAIDGNGGLVETSGKQYLDTNGGLVNTLAPNGNVGNWLLDPTNIYIAINQAAATAAGMVGNNNSAGTVNAGVFQASGAVQDSLLTTGNLVGALVTTNVTVTTANIDGTGVGNINVISPFTIPADRIVTLQADNNILLGSGSLISLNTTARVNLYAGNTVATGGITSMGNIRGSPAGGGSVYMRAGTAGVIALNTSLGATATFGSLQIDSNGTSKAVLSSQIFTENSQTYNIPVELTLNVSLTANNNAVIFNSTIDTDAGARNLTVNAGAGAITLAGAVGGGVNGALGAITLNSTGITTIGSTVAAASFSKTDVGSTLLNGGSLTTSGQQSYAGPVIIGADTTLNTTNSAVTFSSTLDRDVAAARALAINAGSGSITLPGDIGSGVNGALGGLALNSTGVTTLSGVIAAASLTTNTGGSTTLNSSAITTSGNILFGDALTLAVADKVLTSTAGSISFNNTVDGGFGLTLNGNTGVTFGGIVGGSTPLTSLAVTGATTISGNMTTSGSQLYNQPIILNNSTTLTSNTSDVTVNSISKDSPATTRNLSISAPAGNINLNGSFGSSGAELTSIVLAAPVINYNNNSFYAPTLDIQAPTNNIIGTIYSSSTFQLSGDAYLNGDATITSPGAVSAANYYNFSAVTPASLTINADSFGFGNIGGGANGALNDVTITAATSLGTNVTSNSLAVNGIMRLNAGDINTTLNQTYNGEVRLLGNHNFTSSAGNILFGDQLLRDGGVTLYDSNITAAGNIDFNGNVGIGGLGDFVITSGGLTTFNAIGNFNSLSVTGTTQLNNSTIITTNGQTYDDVLLGGIAVIAANGPVNMAAIERASIGGSFDLTIGAGASAINVLGDIGTGINGAVGDLVFNSSNVTTLGGNINAGSITTNAGGSTVLNGGTVTTSGAQTYNDAVALGGNAVFSATNSNIIFASTVDGVAGTNDLTVNTGSGGISFGNTLGAGGFIGNVILNSTGATVFNGDVNVASLITDVGGTTTINSASILTSGNQTYGDVVTLATIPTSLTSSGGAITFADSAIVNQDTTLTASTINIMNGLAGSANLNVIGTGGNATLTVQGPGSQLFNINSADAGTVDNVGGYSGALTFNNIQNLIGGVNGATFKFADGATIGTVSGNSLNSVNTIDITSFAEDMEVVLTATNDGSVQDMQSNLFTNFSNINQLTANNAYNNTITTQPNQLASLLITDAYIGDINSQLDFNGFNTINSPDGSNVNFTAPYTYDASTDIYTVNGTPMYLTGYIPNPPPAPPIPTMVSIDVAKILQQPIANADQKNSAPNSVSSGAVPEWVLLGTAIEFNLTVILTDISKEFDVEKRKRKNTSILLTR